MKVKFKRHSIHRDEYKPPVENTVEAFYYAHSHELRNKLRKERAKRMEQAQREQAISNKLNILIGNLNNLKK